MVGGKSSIGKCFNFRRSHGTKKPKRKDIPSPPTAPLTQQLHRSGDLRRVFHTVDANSDSKISGQELESLLLSLGNSRGDAAREAAAMMKAADADGDGYIGEEEFLAVMKMVESDGECMEDLKEAFTVYDVDRDGRITAGELHRVMKGVVGDGDGGSLKDCSEMIRAVGGAGEEEGGVGFDDFVGLLKKPLVDS